MCRIRVAHRWWAIPIKSVQIHSQSCNFQTNQILWRWMERWFSNRIEWKSRCNFEPTMARKFLIVCELKWKTSINCVHCSVYNIIIFIVICSENSLLFLYFELNFWLYLYLLTLLNRFHVYAYSSSPNEIDRIFLWKKKKKMKNT